MPNTERTPAVFIGHGTPRNAVWDNEWTRGWSEFGASIPRPQAILSISAHWLTRGGVFVTSDQTPKMTYDMHGFPEELYRVTYPAPGNVRLAEQITAMLSGQIRVNPDTEWGFDHGTWVVLRHMFPNADVPVVQLSMDYTQPPAFHYELAKQLRGLRTEGVLILGSGNVVHNPRQRRNPDDTIPDWALEFDERITSYVNDGNHQAIIDFQQMGNVAKLAHPTYEHFLPLLYILGVKNESEEVVSFLEGFQKTISMRSFRLA